MKIIMKRERGKQWYNEKYDLNEAYAGIPEIPVGILLLYIFMKDKEMDFFEISACVESEYGEPDCIFTKTDREKYFDLQKLNEMFKQQNLASWEISCEFEKEKIYITGKVDSTVLSIRIPLQAKINMLPIMNRVELSTYEYHMYAPNIIEKMKVLFHLNQKMTIVALQKLEKHMDIYEEFINALQKDIFTFPKEGAVEVEQYTAGKLYETQRLSILGAYNYLIYLREKPQDALNDLKLGLPRK